MIQQKEKYLIGAILIFLSSGIYFLLAYIGYNKQFLQLSKLEKYSGQVYKRGTVERKSKYRPIVFYLKLYGLDETLGIYRMNRNYQELIRKINPGDSITVYYDSHPKDDVNIDLVQIEKNNEIIVDASEYKKKESSLIYIGLLGGIGSIIASIWYFTKYYK